MKRIVAILLAMFIVFTFVGCGACESEDSYKEIVEGFVTVKELDTSYRKAYMVYDKDTRVMYIVTEGYYGAPSFSPYYDSNGDVAFYKGD